MTAAAVFACLHVHRCGPSPCIPCCRTYVVEQGEDCTLEGASVSANIFTFTLRLGLCAPRHQFLLAH